LLNQPFQNARFEIIATVGPASVSTGVVKALAAAGATIFRLNGAHTPPQLLPGLIDDIRVAVDGRIRLMLDLPGAKVRTQNLTEPVRLVGQREFSLRHDQITHPEFLNRLRPGDEVLAADATLRFVVARQLADRTVFVAEWDGLLESNRGLHVGGRTYEGAYVSERDREILQVALMKRPDFLSLSFVRAAADVRAVREVVGADSGIGIIAKIETGGAYSRLDEILDEVQSISIDRGDLASEIGLHQIPLAQRAIVRRAQARGRRVFLATQFLRSMVEHPVPLIAELESVHAAIASGVSGIQLSEETAAGRYPAEAVRVVVSQLESVRRGQAGRSVPGSCVWLIGLSGSGKTTLGRHLQQTLAREYGIQAELLDGDAIRAADARPLGYSREDRVANIQRIIYLSGLLNRNNVTTIVANISPFEELRRKARAELPNYIEVYLECPVEVCAARDPKGLYARARSGEIGQVIGVDDPFDPPTSPDLVINTSKTTPEDAARAILGYLAPVPDR
jgi:adenylyl-sulfate kinase